MIFEIGLWKESRFWHLRLWRGEFERCTLVVTSFWCIFECFASVCSCFYSMCTVLGLLDVIQSRWPSMWTEWLKRKIWMWYGSLRVWCTFRSNPNAPTGFQSMGVKTYFLQPKILWLINSKRYLIWVSVEPKCGKEHRKEKIVLNDRWTLLYGA